MNADDDGWTMGEAASGDLGLMHLDHADFVQAMDILLKGGLWEDASFIAERVLNANELKAYVDRLPVPPLSAHHEPEPPLANGAGITPVESYSAQLRNLLGRRLVREDRYTEAAKYLAPPYDKIVQKYSAALREGANTRLPREKRAQALFTAAWLARYDGVELMGTEVAPDGFDFGGDFEDADLAQERLSGGQVEQGYDSDGSAAPLVKNVATASKREIRRLKENTIDPDKRYHYRYIAAALAMRAAALLPDNTEELADVVNTAGNWIKNSDEKLGDRYFQVIDRRCSKTTIGAQDSAAHWFIDTLGPWSTAQQAAYDGMHKVYGDTKSKGR